MLPIVGTNSKVNPIMNSGLTYFVSYKSFLFLELLYHMALRMNQQGYKVDAHKEHFIIDLVQYTLMIFIDYSLTFIIHTFSIPNDWVNKIKK